MNLKTGHWILIGLTGTIVVLLFLAPHQLSSDGLSSESSQMSEPPTVENDIDSALAIIASEAPMQGILLLRKIAEENPSNFRAQYNMGKFSAQTSQWEKVIERFESVMDIDPSFSESHYWMGLARFNLGEIDQAKNHLQQYVADEQDNTQLRDEAARMLNQIN